MISPEFKSKVLDSVDIVEVISDYVLLKKTGSSFRGKSPFTTEKTPSFFVVPSKSIWKDFSSGKSGDVFEFLILHERMSFPEAVCYLAAKYGIPIEEKSVVNDEETILRKEISIAYENAHAVYKQFWRSGFPDVIEAESEILRRGFTEEMVHRFELGYAPVRSCLSPDSEKVSLYNKAGLISQQGDRLYDYFRSRIIFPIYSSSNKLVGFTGRTTRKEKDVVKFLHSRETALFHKSRCLYGLIHARKHIIDKDLAYFVEGPWDYHAMEVSGIQNTVGSLGTSITADQLRIISRLTDNFCFVMDGDAAGLNAARRVLSMCLEIDLLPQFVFMPAEHDPDSLRRMYGNDYLVKATATKVKTTEAIFFLSSYDPSMDIEKKNEALGYISDTISKAKSLSTRELLIEDLSFKLNLTIKALSGSVSKLIKKTDLQGSYIPNPTVGTENPRYITEECICALLKYQAKTRMYGPHAEETFAFYEVWNFISATLMDYGVSFTRLDIAHVPALMCRVLKKEIPLEEALVQIPVIVDHGFFEHDEFTIGAIVEKYCIELIIDASNDYMENLEDKAPMQIEIEQWKKSLAALAKRPKQIREFLNGLDIR